jgi:hypothetical protein
MKSPICYNVPDVFVGAGAPEWWQELSIALLKIGWMILADSEIAKRP